MNKEAILEGLLYIQGDIGLSIEDVEKILEINSDEAKSLILSLKNKYEDITRGLRINYLGNTFKLTTKPEHKEYYKKLLDEDSSCLSGAALETLAIIAYNEPITRLDIDNLRGVDTTYTLRRLIARGFIKECGRSELPGRAILYKTTDLFLDYFNLSSKDDLPKISENLDDNDINNDETNLFLSNYREV